MYFIHILWGFTQSGNAALTRFRWTIFGGLRFHWLNIGEAVHVLPVSEFGLDIYGQLQYFVRFSISYGRSWLMSKCRKAKHWATYSVTIRHCWCSNVEYSCESIPCRLHHSCNYGQYSDEMISCVNYILLENIISILNISMSHMTLFQRRKPAF